jgi:cytochrome c biogenesis protein CcmG/thiol:disulfide interchange protein DsbE
MFSKTFLLENRRWTTLVIVVLLLGTVWTFLGRVPQAATTGGELPPSPREGFSAPDFTLDLLTDGQITLSDLRGQVVMVNLWASWCLPCREEMPTIEKVFQEYKPQGLEVLAVNTTYQDREAEVASFVTQFGLTFPILLDKTGAVSNRYALRGLPSTYFVDRKGIIRSVVVGGPMSEALIRSKIQDLLEETR